MSSPSLAPNFRHLQGGVRIVDKEGLPTKEFLTWLRNLDVKTGLTLTGMPSPGGPPAGKIATSAAVAGRSEGLGTTLQNLDSDGIVTAPGVDFTRAYSNKNIDNVPDGTAFVRTDPDQRDGGGRGFIALDVNSRIADSFRNNQVNVSAIPTSAATLSNDGVSTAIPITSNTNQYGSGMVNNNLGTIDPGVFGTFYVFADDPTFSGGALAYQFSTDVLAQGANDGRVFLGKITTVLGTPGTGGGNSGGSSGGSGGRGFLR